VAENWTQPGIFATAPSQSDIVLSGTYGTLDLAPNGTWDYGLNNSSTAVQALTQNQTVTDAFAVQATDSNGVSVATPITISVAGNSPSLGVSISGAGTGVAVNGTQAFNQFLGFGDSNIDSGYFYTHTITYSPFTETLYQISVSAGGGIPTSLNGEMNSSQLAQDFGLTAIPVGETGGSNYGASGATVTGALSGSLAPAISTQIQTYLTSTNGVANPNAIYLVNGGGNDEKIAATLDPASGQAFMISEANALAASIAQLHAAGAQYIVYRDNGSGTSESGQFGALFNETLLSDLATLARGSDHLRRCGRTYQRDRSRSGSLWNHQRQ
jgi:VCBS repeat-containing protein